MLTQETRVYPTLDGGVVLEAEPRLDEAVGQVVLDFGDDDQIDEVDRRKLVDLRLLPLEHQVVEMMTPTKEQSFSSFTVGIGDVPSWASLQSVAIDFRPSLPIMCLTLAAGCDGWGHDVARHHVGQTRRPFQRLRLTTLSHFGVCGSCTGNSPAASWASRTFARCL